MWGPRARRFAGLGQPPLMDLSGLRPRLRKQPDKLASIRGFLRRAMISKPDKARVFTDPLTRWGHIADECPKTADAVSFDC